MTPSRLTRGFAREHGMSIPEYVRAIRLIESIDRIRQEKVEAVARDVGYKSRKNFNRTFKRLTGLTPTAFRQLPAVRADEIIESTRFAMSRARARRERGGAPAHPSHDAAADSRRAAVRSRRWR